MAHQLILQRTYLPLNKRMKRHQLVFFEENRQFQIRIGPSSDAGERNRILNNSTTFLI